MKKIQSLFKRDYEGTRQAYDEVVPGSEWVLRGEGTPFIKWDGTSCAVIDGNLYKRYDAKHGKKPPEGSIPCEESPNEHTGHWPHWVLVSSANPADKHHLAAWAIYDGTLKDGTYELVGPKVNNNRHDFNELYLISHNDPTKALSEINLLTFQGIKDYLSYLSFEGIVWHHPDGRMVKVKRSDFGWSWPIKEPDSNG